MQRFIFLSMVLLSAGLAQGMTLDKAKGKTEFRAVVKPVGIRILGQGDGPEGKLELKKDQTNFLMSGTVEMNIASFDTGMSTRNTHMKEKYLEVEKYPKAKLVITEVKVNKELLANGGDLIFEAKLNLHGVDKPVQVAMSLAPLADGIKTTSKFNLKISDFAIEKPTFSGLTVSDEVEVSAEAQIAKAELSEAK